MSYASGIFNTESFQGRTQPSFANTQFKRYPQGSAPLLAMSSQLKRTACINTIHSWGADSMPLNKTTLSGALLAVAPGTSGTIQVADSTRMIAGTIWQVLGTQENFLVEAVLSNTQVTVRRGFGTIPAQNTAAGATIIKITNAQEEASMRPTAQANFSYYMDNQTQILRNSYAMSGTAQAIQELLRQTGETPDRLAKNKADAAMQHAMDLELALIFGQRTLSHKNGQPIGTMDGAISLLKKYAPQNVKQLASTTTFDQLGAALEPCTLYATDPSTGNSRVIFTGNSGYKFLNKMGRSVMGNNITFDRSTNGFGMRFTNFMTDFGDFKIVTHPLFNTAPEWSNQLLVVDLATFETAYLGGRDTRLMGYNNEGQAANSAMSDSNGIDAAMGTYLTEMTMVMGLPEANAYITGACDVAVDTIMAAPTTFAATFCISHPCSEGFVKPGDSIFLEIKNSKPSTAHTVVTPTGDVSITTDVNGNGTVQYQFAASALPTTYTFVAVGNGNTMNVAWTGQVQTACIGYQDPCELEVVTTQAEPIVC